MPFDFFLASIEGLVLLSHMRRGFEEQQGPVLV
jgi:hypothetical protein